MNDTDKYMEDVEEKCNLIMNLMDDEEREFEIKCRIRERNKMVLTLFELDAEVKQLRKLRDEITKLLHIDKINSECCICGKAIEVPEGEVWS
jgi:hypothetical protein